MKKKVGQRGVYSAIDRRQFIQLGVRFSVVASSLLIIPTVNADETRCVDSEDLSSGEIGLRRSLAYTDKAPQANKDCRACGFFTAESEGQCGNCQILNGPVAAEAWCESWSNRS